MTPPNGSRPVSSERSESTGGHVWNHFDLLRVLAMAHDNAARTRVKEVTMHRVVSNLLVGVLVTMALGVSGTATAQSAPKPLYDRLGGVYSIATVVDDFIERLLVDDTLNANPAIREARARVPKAGLKFHVTALVCEVTGGPCKYTGRTMKDSHAKLNINERQWQAMIVDFRRTLDKYKVPTLEQNELVKIVESTRKDIVAGS
jgi:hemoglobin